MKFLVVTLAPTLKKDDGFYSYAPYVYEMNLWAKYVDEFGVISPISYSKKLLLSKFDKEPEIFPIPSFSFTSGKEILKSLVNIPIIMMKMYKAMKWADHIHLRCPGNIGLLGCIVQIAFPKKVKTVKYAGNWDPKSKQPKSYKLQQWLLKNEFLSKKTQVLVYGNWKDTSKNIKPFFTASYTDEEKEPIEDKNYQEQLNLLFVGTLSSGKQPIISVKAAHELLKKGVNVTLDLYGEGVKRDELERYIEEHDLKDHIILHGNQSRDTVKEAYKKAHFLVFISKSEGWPKVVAESMFWKCVPISTAVSCVPDMLGYGERGSLVAPSVENVVNEIQHYIDKPEEYTVKSNKAYNWSRIYTLDKFEESIKELLVEY